MITVESQLNKYLHELLDTDALKEAELYDV